MEVWKPGRIDLAVNQSSLWLGVLDIAHLTEYFRQEYESGARDAALQNRLAV
jgi:hypothetical protein